MSFKINGESIQVTMFPDKTSQVWKLPEWMFDRMNINIEWDFEHEGEVMHLAQIADLFYRNRTPNIQLNVSYLPYARQDKFITNSSTFAYFTFISILNRMGFHQINILDPHNYKAIEAITNSKIIKPDILKYIRASESRCVCFPDKGAADRGYNIDNQGVIILNKQRNPSTGDINHIEVINESSIKGKRILIVDDICDGGGTFKMAAELLLKHGASNVDLYVTHGIFSKGIKTLRDSGINRIFTNKGEVSEVQGNICYKEIK